MATRIQCGFRVRCEAFQEDLRDRFIHHRGMCDWRADLRCWRTYLRAVRSKFLSTRNRLFFHDESHVSSGRRDSTVGVVRRHDRRSLLLLSTPAEDRVRSLRRHCGFYYWVSRQRPRHGRSWPQLPHKYLQCPCRVYDGDNRRGYGTSHAQ